MIDDLETFMEKLHENIFKQQEPMNSNDFNEDPPSQAYVLDMLEPGVNYLKMMDEVMNDFMSGNITRLTKQQISEEFQVASETQDDSQQNPPSCAPESS